MIAFTIQIGHFHPILVHLPIGILFLGFILEIYFRKKASKTSNDIILLILGIGAISALASVGTGWLLGEDGDYDQTLLFRHRWLAIAFTGFSMLLYFLKKSTPPVWTKFYFPTFLLTIVLLIVTGHYGGSMTHGEAYLFKENSAKKVIIEDIEKAKVYTDIIQPILNNKCVSCHNPTKIKGGLKMDSKESLITGGDSGSILDSTSTGDSPQILHRLALPISDEEHMPPNGKVQLTSEEIALLKWWMDNDNCFDCVVENLDKTEAMDKILVSLEEDTSTHALLAKNASAVPDDWLTNLRNNNISAYRLAENNPLVTVDLGGRDDLTIAIIKSLKKYAKNIVVLNLANSNFNDTLSQLLPSFKNLTKLQLQNTPISDKTLEYLDQLKKLELLNLYGTNITNASFETLKQLPNLQKAYLWQTQITSEATEKFTLDYPTIKIQGQIDEAIFASTSLEPPSIITESDFFKDSLQVTLDYVFNDANIYYSLDGSAPDSTAIKYERPFLIKNSTEIRAVTQKSGWKLSEVSIANFKKTGIDYTGIDLNKKPNDRYKGQGEKTLIDYKRGSTNFVDGNWIGFEGEHFTATIQLKQKEQVSTISVGALSSPEKWIFYPTGFRIWVSNDAINYKLVHSSKLPAQQPNSDTKLRFFDLDIPPSTTKYIKIEIKSQLKNPTWHPNPGGKSWLFVDEILLN